MQPGPLIEPFCGAGPLLSSRRSHRTFGRVEPVHPSPILRGHPMRGPAGRGTNRRPHPPIPPPGTAARLPARTGRCPGKLNHPEHVEDLRSPGVLASPPPLEWWVVCPCGDGRAHGAGRVVGSVRAGGPACSIVDAGRRSAPVRGSRGTGRDHLRGHDGLHLAAAAAGLRPLWSDGAPALHRVDRRSSLGEAAPPHHRRAGFARRPGLVALRDRLRAHAGPDRGA